MTDIIIHDITIDEFAEYDNGGVGYLIGTGRVDEVKHGQMVLLMDEGGKDAETD